MLPVTIAIKPNTGFFELDNNEVNKLQLRPYRTCSEHAGVNNNNNDKQRHRRQTSSAGAANTTEIFFPNSNNKINTDPIAVLRLTKSIEQELNKSYEQAVIISTLERAALNKSNKRNSNGAGCDSYELSKSCTTSSSSAVAPTSRLSHANAPPSSRTAPTADNVETTSRSSLSSTSDSRQQKKPDSPLSSSTPHPVASTISTITTPVTSPNGYYELEQVDSSTALTTKSSSDSTQCRICYGSETPHYDGNIHKNVRVIGQKSRLGFVRPCACMGSVMFVHPACLIEWIKRSGKYTCEICHSRYSVRRYGLRPPWHWVAAPVAPEDRVHFVIFFFSLFFVVGTVLWLYWLCNESVEDEEIEFIITAIVLYAIIDMLFFAIILMEFWLSVLPFVRNWLRVNQRIIIESYQFSGPIPSAYQASLTTAHADTHSESSPLPSDLHATATTIITTATIVTNNNDTASPNLANATSDSITATTTIIKTTTTPTDRNNNSSTTQTTVVDAATDAAPNVIIQEIPPQTTAILVISGNNNSNWSKKRRQQLECKTECRTTSTMTLYSSDEVHYDFCPPGGDNGMLQLHAFEGCARNLASESSKNLGNSLENYNNNNNSVEIISGITVASAPVVSVTINKPNNTMEQACTDSTQPISLALLPTCAANSIACDYSGGGAAVASYLQDETSFSGNKSVNNNTMVKNNVEIRLSNM